MQAQKTSRWTVTPNGGFDGICYQEDVPLTVLGERQCLVRVEAVSLNYRDIAIALGRYPLPVNKPIVACSDAAGQVVSVGAGVTEFQIGDSVCTLFMQDHQDGIITPDIRQSTLGSQRDGVLQKYAVFEETGLVAIPSALSYIEASTLPCAAVTAWNCLFGLQSRALQPGDWVLTQGTGGVSLFAIQFAHAVGAVVIATTSSADKEKKLKALGVRHVINYASDCSWGKTARQLTPDGLGVHHVIEVGGETNMSQTLGAIRPEGIVSIVGFLGNGKVGVETPSFSVVQRQLCIVRGINVGSRKMFQEMNVFLEEHGIKPIVSTQSFDYSKSVEAFKYMEKQNFWGKIVIKMD
jgi:NADPH:quinone reductase-like Zn-dependent oxidoreductase